MPAQLSKAVRYTPDGEIEIKEIEVSDPVAGEIQIEGGACGICAWDIATCKLGKAMEMPAPPGHEGVGYVCKVGADVNDFKIGDRVMGGGFAQIRNIVAKNSVKLPESKLPDEQWIVEPVACVVTGLDHCRLKAGERVVVIGAGFMGLLILQGLARSYADQVIAIDINPDRLKSAREMGCETFNSREMDPKELGSKLKARGIDVVVETSGTKQGMMLATSIAKRGGIVNLFGWLKETVEYNFSSWHLGGFTVINSSPASGLRNTCEPAIRLIQKGFFDLKPLVTHKVPLTEYPALMKRILKGDPSYIKGVVTLS